MAADSKPAVIAAAPDSPELSHFRSREKDLVEKGKRLESHPESEQHDIAEAKLRNEQALKEVRAEIKRLSKQ